MINGIRTIYPQGLNKVFGSMFHVDSRVRHETPKESWRRQRYESNNEDHSPNI